MLVEVALELSLISMGTDMTIKSKTTDLPLASPSVDEAPGGVLDPQNIPPEGATVRVTAYNGMAYRDHVYIHVADYSDDILISSIAVGKDVLFTVPAHLFDVGAGGTINVHYKVEFYLGEKLDSLVLELKIADDFEGPAVLDLSRHNYVVIADKPPLAVPAFVRVTRPANWGVAPYVYNSSAPEVADVNPQTGEVTAYLNGATTITAIDSRSESRRYSLTVSGIRQLHFLTASAHWEGMKEVCIVAGLEPVPLADIKRLWAFYYPSGGPVAEYAGWLPYQFWTADALGAGTAWAYDLDGSQVNDNASSFSTDTYLQALGMALR